MSTPVSRHFATVGQTQVHYRRAGAGPAVLLLHQSPSSSAELVPLMQRLAGRFTLIAPDMPGYGASEAGTSATLSIEFLADHTAAFMDELGIGTAAVYGFHTGASVALCLARRHPRRLKLAICEGLLCLDEPERRVFLDRYIEAFSPRFDGGHLAWLWTRIKDQSVFFPWYERTAAARLDLDAALPAALAERALDWLRSGTGYAAGYAAAFNYDPRTDLPFIERPIIALCHRHDPLAAHLPRLPPLAAPSLQCCFATAEERHELVQSALLRYAGETAAPAAPGTRPIAGRAWQDYVIAHGLGLRVLRIDGRGGRAAVFAHAAQSSALACREWLAARDEQGPAIAIELPGHGESEGFAGPEREAIAGWADLVSAALHALGVDDCDLVGWGAGAAIQVEVAHRQQTRAHSLNLIAALDLTHDPDLQTALGASYTAPTVDSYGGFLLRAWHEARDHRLFFPWYDRRRVCAIRAFSGLTPDTLQACTRDALLAAEGGTALRRAEIRYPLRERLAALPIPARHAAASTDPRYGRSRALAGQSAHFFTLSENSALAARQLSALLDAEPP